MVILHIGMSDKTNCGYACVHIDTFGNTVKRRRQSM